MILNNSAGISNRINNRSGKKADKTQSERYSKIAGNMKERFGKSGSFLVNVPGRVEISGNHTDHNNGLVLASSINPDIIAEASPAADKKIRILDLQFNKEIKIDLSGAPGRKAAGSPDEALIIGVLEGLESQGFNIGGFNAVIDSIIRPGSGLSSSAAFEITIATIISKMYNNWEIPVISMAKAGKYAENNYFGKPSGLMDQLACASGGIISIDFRDSSNPEIQKIRNRFTEHGYSMILVLSGSSHAELTSEYASITEEMHKTASIFNKETCRELNHEMIINAAPEIRRTCGDRAFLRTMHYLDENQRVGKQINLLKEGQIDEFIHLVNESGNSSWKYLQNITAEGNPGKQELGFLLSVSDWFIRKTGKGATRVHGGGFAGTILTLIPSAYTAEYIELITGLGESFSATELNIREKGIIIEE